jgi:hypothetical protein
MALRNNKLYTGKICNRQLASIKGHDLLQSLLNIRQTFSHHKAGVTERKAPPRGATDLAAPLGGQVRVIEIVVEYALQKIYGV